MRGLIAGATAVDDPPPPSLRACSPPVACTAVAEERRSCSRGQNAMKEAWRVVVTGQFGGTPVTTSRLSRAGHAAHVMSWTSAPVTHIEDWSYSAPGCKITCRQPSKHRSALLVFAKHHTQISDSPSPFDWECVGTTEHGARTTDHHPAFFFYTAVMKSGFIAFASKEVL